MELTWAPGQRVDVTEHLLEDAAAPLLVIWPAFGASARYYRHLAAALGARGIASVVVEYPDREGGRDVGRHTTYGYDALATWVHEAVMARVRETRPDAPIHLLGHSLGGQVSLMASALHAGTAHAPDGLILVASGSPYWKAYGRMGFLRSYLGTTAMATVARVVGYWPGDRLKFWGRQSRVLVADWSRLARTGHVRPHGASRDYDAALAAYEGDVLAISLPDDDLAPVRSLEHLLSLTPQAHVTRWHSPERIDHIAWVRENETIVPIIADWVHARASAS